MNVEDELSRQGAELRKILMKSNDSEIIGMADEFLLFLNRLHDLMQLNKKRQIPFSSISDIIYGLESNPERMLQDQEIRSRLLNILSNLAK
jgi:hypothetical protein